jgi:hypothetical protein
VPPLLLAANHMQLHIQKKNHCCCISPCRIYPTRCHVETTKVCTQNHLDPTIFAVDKKNPTLFYRCNQWRKDKSQETIKWINEDAKPMHIARNSHGIRKLYHTYMVFIGFRAKSFVFIILKDIEISQIIFYYGV